MIDRYPGVIPDKLDEALLNRGELENNLELVHQVATLSVAEIQDRLTQFGEMPSIESLEQLSQSVVKAFPLYDSTGELNPMYTTEEQIRKVITDEKDGIGDCKLLTIYTTYLTSSLLRLPTIVSVRVYSGHPVLYIKDDQVTYKISYLHEKPKVNSYSKNQEDPFDLIDRDTEVTIFQEPDFTHSRSLLYWKVRDASFVLDGINLLRRCVVNYCIDPNGNKQIFEEVINRLQTEEMNTSPIITYWESEMERIIDLYQQALLFSGSRFSTDEFRNKIIKSLRFS